MPREPRESSQSFINARPGPIVVAVGGGKGGVGKSVVAANLSCALAQLGSRVVAVDADLGSANLHTLFGIDRPGSTLQAFLDGRTPDLEEVTVPTSVQRLALIPGSVAVAGAANIVHARKQKLLRHIARIDADVVVIDCGAGIHFNVVDFFSHADVRLVVAMPQLVSLQNAYGFMKATVYRLLRQAGEDTADAAHFDRATTGAETETVPQLLSRIAREDLRLATLLGERIRAFQVTLVGNQLSERGDISTVQALARMARDFLALEAHVACGMRRSERIHGSVTTRRPFYLDGAGGPDAHALEALAELVLTHRKVSVPRAVAMPA